MPTEKRVDGGNLSPILHFHFYYFSDSSTFSAFDRDLESRPIDL